ncbi:hypothetical protein EG328_003148 [Venturia inaequalis]|uniref:Rhodopsin domain-containing protein n=1 Tax=Venturia inaequalis TaxID=5025 RepID=A0A8H3YVS7_VENIN|nr:hypothetical protein EG328_003148 [Venturia inaequalis]
MRDIPIAVLLAWPAADYQHPMTRGLSAPITIATLSSFAVVAVGLRVYTRLYVQKWPGYDDWLLILAVTTTIALNSVVGYAIVHYGWSRHIYDIPPRFLAASAMIVFIAKLLFQMATFFLRLSLLSFYYRLVHDSEKHRFRIALHCTVIFVIILFIAGACIGIFVCVPIQDYWVYPPDPHRRCFDEGPVGFVVAILNCLADLLITCLPMPLVLQLNLPRRSEIGVLVGFCLGFIVSIAAAFRTYYWYQAFIVSYDLTWEAYPLWIASSVEVNIGMICACAPAIRVLVQKKFIPTLSQLSESEGSRSDERSGEHSKRTSKLWGSMHSRNSIARPFSSSPRSVMIGDPIPLSHGSISDCSTTLSPSGLWPLKSPQQESPSIQLDDYVQDREREDFQQTNPWRDSIATSTSASWPLKEPREREDSQQSNPWRDSIATSTSASWPLKEPEKDSYPIQLDIHSQGRARGYTRQSSSLTNNRLYAKSPPVAALSGSSSISSLLDRSMDCTHGTTNQVDDIRGRQGTNAFCFSGFRYT